MTTPTIEDLTKHAPVTMRERVLLQAAVKLLGEAASKLHTEVKDSLSEIEDHLAGGIEPMPEWADEIARKVGTGSMNDAEPGPRVAGLVNDAEVTINDLYKECDGLQAAIDSFNLTYRKLVKLHDRVAARRMKRTLGKMKLTVK